MDKPDLQKPADPTHALPAFDDNANTHKAPVGPAPTPGTVPPPFTAAPGMPTIVMTAPELGGAAAVPGRRSTVLPRIAIKDDALALLPSNQDRYQPLRRLGAGAMGEVSLEQDNDIGRTVAVKRLTADSDNTDGLVRFIAEVQTIGRLEHPNIVPIHDVGLDQDGRYYFVMKYVDGETLETIITRLAAGDPDYHSRYPVEVRLEMFLGLLHALQYAHDQGVVHRDIKPANVMIGRYGEVVLMDWGIAKQIRGSAVLPPAHARTNPDLLDPRERLFSTRNDQCVGTPAYMSPEQVMGKNDQIDERSDIYSATVLLHELLSLRHYLAEHETLNSLMVAITTLPMPYTRLLFNHHPDHPAPRAEMLHVIARGLAKAPAQRYQSAMEMIGEMQRAIDGRCRVSCPATTAKRILREIGGFVDRHPLASPFFFYAAVLLILFSLCFTAYALAR